MKKLKIRVEDYQKPENDEFWEKLNNNRWIKFVHYPEESTGLKLEDIQKSDEEILFILKNYGSDSENGETEEFDLEDAVLNIVKDYLTSNEFRAIFYKEYKKAHERYIQDSYLD